MTLDIALLGISFSNYKESKRAFSKNSEIVSFDTLRLAFYTWYVF